MLDVVLSNRFKKDLKLAARRGMNLAELDAIVEQLAAQLPLPDKNRDHALTGNATSGPIGCWSTVWTAKI